MPRINYSSNCFADTTSTSIFAGFGRANEGDKARPISSSCFYGGGQTSYGMREKRFATVRVLWNKNVREREV